MSGLSGTAQRYTSACLVLLANLVGFCLSLATSPVSRPIGPLRPQREAPHLEFAAQWAEPTLQLAALVLCVVGIRLALRQRALVRDIPRAPATALATSTVGIAVLAWHLLQSAAIYALRHT